MRTSLYILLSLYAISEISNGGGDFIFSLASKLLHLINFSRFKNFNNFVKEWGIAHPANSHQKHIIYLKLLTNQQNEKIHFIKNHIVPIPIGNGV